MSESVRLRPVQEVDLDLLEVGPTPETDPWNFFGHRSPGRTRRGFAENGLLSDTSGTLVVEVAGAFAGDVSFHTVPYGPPSSPPAYNIGISLLPSHRGRGYGSIAQRLLADHLFATYAVNRVEASTDVANVAEQRSLRKAGFSYEGVLRGAQWRSGAWHDLMSFARLRGDAG